MRALALTAAALLAATPLASGDPSFWLSKNHAAFEWRKMVGAPMANNDMRKVVHWVRQEQVGIGNTFGGYAAVMMENVFLEDRTLVITSRILQKFCELVSCRITKMPGSDRLGFRKEAYKELKDSLEASQYFMNFGQYVRNGTAEHAKLAPYYAAVGCKLPNPQGEWDDDTWTHRCLYGRLVRAMLVGGPEGRLQREKAWLRDFFVGDPKRLHKVLQVDMSPDAVPVYDVVLHIRTLALIEDMGNKNGRPLNVSSKSKAFIESDKFEAMVQCFAMEVFEKYAPAAAARAAAARAAATILVNEAAAADTAPHSAKHHHHHHHHNNNNNNGGGGSSGGSGGGKEGILGAEALAEAEAVLAEGPGTRLRVYLATDALELREPFSRRFKRALETLLSPQQSNGPVQHRRRARRRLSQRCLDEATGGCAAGAADVGSGSDHVYPRQGQKHPQDHSQERKQPQKQQDQLEEQERWRRRLRGEPRFDAAAHGPWDVSVDYLSPLLPPAHFWVWTHEMRAMTQDNWREISGTVLEWLLMSQGHAMLTVKGIRGGERALPSSFAMSAAALGRTGIVEFLKESGPKVGKCKWQDISSFD